MSRVIRVGTRKSDLALVQTNFIIDEIKKIDNTLKFEIVAISTKGDKILDKPLVEFGGKGVFIDEFENALLKNEIDIAVHSAKDMPMDIPKGLTIVGVPKRENPTDVMIYSRDILDDECFSVGTSSLRRQIQIQKLYNVKCENLRGNVPTRIKHLKDGKFDAIILATAGLNRLKLNDIDGLKYRYFTPEEFIPSAGQGILAVEGRKDDSINEIISKINDVDTKICLEFERSVLKKLNSGCHEAVGVYSYIKNDLIFARAIYELNGKIKIVSDNAKITNLDSLAINISKRLLNDE